MGSYSTASSSDSSGDSQAMKEHAKSISPKPNPTTPSDNTPAVPDSKASFDNLFAKAGLESDNDDSQPSHASTSVSSEPQTTNVGAKPPSAESPESAKVPPMHAFKQGINENEWDSSSGASTPYDEKIEPKTAQADTWSSGSDTDSASHAKERAEVQTEGHADKVEPSATPADSKEDTDKVVPETNKSGNLKEKVIEQEKGDPKPDKEANPSRVVNTTTDTASGSTNASPGRIEGTPPVRQAPPKDESPAKESSKLDSSSSAASPEFSKGSRSNRSGASESSSSPSQRSVQSPSAQSEPRSPVEPKPISPVAQPAPGPGGVPKTVSSSHAEGEVQRKPAVEKRETLTQPEPAAANTPKEKDPTLAPKENRTELGKQDGSQQSSTNNSGVSEGASGQGGKTDVLKRLEERRKALQSHTPTSSSAALVPQEGGTPPADFKDQSRAVKGAAVPVEKPPEAAAAKVGQSRAQESSASLNSRTADEDCLPEGIPRVVTTSPLESKDQSIRSQEDSPAKPPFPVPVMVLAAKNDDLSSRLDSQSEEYNPRKSDANDWKALVTRSARGSASDQKQSKSSPVVVQSGNDNKVPSHIRLSPEGMGEGLQKTEAQTRSTVPTQTTGSGQKQQTKEQTQPETSESEIHSQTRSQQKKNAALEESADITGDADVPFDISGSEKVATKDARLSEGRSPTFSRALSGHRAPTDTPVEAHGLTTRQTPKSSPLGIANKQQDPKYGRQRHAAVVSDKGKEILAPPVSEIAVSSPPEDESSLGSMGFLFPPMQTKKQPTADTPEVRVVTRLAVSTPKVGYREKAMPKPNMGETTVGAKDHKQYVTHRMKPTIGGVDYNFYKSWVRPGSATAARPSQKEDDDVDRKDPPESAAAFNVGKSHPQVSRAQEKAKPDAPVVHARAADAQRTRHPLDVVDEYEPSLLPPRSPSRPSHRASQIRQPDEWEAWVKAKRDAKEQAAKPKAQPKVVSSNVSLGSDWAPPKRLSHENDSADREQPSAERNADNNSPSWSDWLPPSRTTRIDFAGEINSQPSALTRAKVEEDEEEDAPHDETADHHEMEDTTEWESDMSPEPMVANPPGPHEDLPIHPESFTKSASESSFVENSEHVNEEVDEEEESEEEESEEEESEEEESEEEESEESSESEEESEELEEEPEETPEYDGEPTGAQEPTHLQEQFLEEGRSELSKDQVSDAPDYGRIHVDDGNVDEIYSYGMSPHGSGQRKFQDERTAGQTCCVFFMLPLVGVGIAVLIILVFFTDVIGSDEPGTSGGPAPAPTFSPSPTPTQSLSDELYSLIISESPGSQEALDDPTSPQGKAFAWLSNNQSLDTYSDSRKLQRYVLAVLYYQANGDFWTNRDLWLSEMKECDWYTSEANGEVCNDEENLDEIDLERNGLRGILPWVEFDILAQQLLILDFNGNDLSGTLPVKVDDFDSLRVLNLGGNRFSGTLPSELGQLSTVRHFDLSDNSLSGTIPSSLSTMSSVLSVRLNDNSMTGTIPTELGLLTDMQHLYLSGNQFVGRMPQDICDLQLDILEVNCELVQCDCCTKCVTGGAIEDEPLYQLIVSEYPDGAEALSSNGSPQSDAFKWLQSSANSGIVSNSKLLHRYALATLYYATGGAQWSAQANWMSSADECTWFSTVSNPCDANGNLVEINLADNNLRGTLPMEVLLLSDSLKNIQLQQNALSGSISSDIASLWNLEQLNLSNNGLEGSIPTEVGRLLNLVRLTLLGNSFDSTIPTQLGNLQKLEYLDVGSNQLTGTIPTTLGSINDLAGLSVYENLLTGRIPTELANVGNLQLLYTDDNKLRGPIPEGVCQLDLEEFWSDCEETQCLCCTTCCVDGIGCAG